MSSPDLLSALKDQIKAELRDELLAELGQGPADPWLDVRGAAAHLVCPESRIYALKSQGALRFEKEGSRVLFRRSWLDEFVSNGGAMRR